MKLTWSFLGGRGPNIMVGETLSSNVFWCSPHICTHLVACVSSETVNIRHSTGSTAPCLLFWAETTRRLLPEISQCERNIMTPTLHVCINIWMIFFKECWLHDVGEEQLEGLNSPLDQSSTRPEAASPAPAAVPSAHKHSNMRQLFTDVSVTLPLLVITSCRHSSVSI